MTRLVAEVTGEVPSGHGPSPLVCDQGFSAVLPMSVRGGFLEFQLFM